MKRASAAVRVVGALRVVRQKKLSWSEISGNSVWAREVSSFISQWKVCEEHDRLRYISCVQCKRSRDTAQVKWEGLNEARVKRAISKRPVIVVHPLTSQFMRKYDIADMEVT